MDTPAREFSLGDVPVHLVGDDLIGKPPARTTEIDGIRTLTLADLISVKLHSGLSSMVRAQDLADVIGLIRCLDLRSDFARRLDKAVRTEFRKLVAAVRESRG